MDDFIKEIKALSTRDLMLIIEDQQDLYTEDELKTVYEELTSRPESTFRLEAESEQNRKKQEKEEQAAEEMARYSHAIHQVMITTTPSFDGYTVVSHKGVLFDEMISNLGLKTTGINMGELFSNFTDRQLNIITDNLNIFKQNLVYSLKEKAYQIGANAIVGFDIKSTFPGGNMVMLSAYGTAVCIQKNENSLSENTNSMTGRKTADPFS